MFVVRSNVPVPVNTRAASASKYPLDSLEVGQSFFIPGAKKSVQVTLSKGAKTRNIKITTRQTVDFEAFDEQGNGIGEKVPGLGVWRIA